MNKIYNLKDGIKIKISFIFYLFCFIFAPPIVPHINTFLIVAIYSAITILLRYKNEVKDIFKKSGMKLFAIGFATFFVYFLIIACINIAIGNRVNLSEYVITTYRFALIFPLALICILYIIIKCKEYKFKIEDIIFSFVLCGLLEFVIALVAFLIPVVHKVLIDTMYYFTRNDILLRPDLVKRRFYGYANDMLDSFGYGVGLMAVLPVILSFRTQKIRYLFFTPCLLFLTFINARTGLFIFAIGFLCVIPMFFMMSKKSQFKFAITFLGLILLLGLLLGLVYIFNRTAFTSSLTDILSIFKFIFKGERRAHGYDTASVLFDPSGWYLPANWVSLLFGTGHTVFSVSGFQNSDVGYINDLWLVGIIGTVILYSTFILLFYKVWKCSKDFLNKTVSLMLLTSLMLFQIKGRAIMANTGLLLTLTLTMAFIYLEFQKELEERNTRDTKPITFSDTKDLREVVSVIVPVYNVEKYLEKCICSLLSQTYSNLEIILVDDGSPDACPQICDSYASKDARIKVIHKKNGGLSDARNAGIEAASGDYIAFVDSDDYIAPQMIQTLLQYAIDKEADISVCNYYKVFENGEKLYQPKTVQEKVMTNLEAMEDIFTASNLCEVITWNKLYAAHLFKDTEIRFPVGKIHEDNFTTYKLFYAAEKVVYVDIPLYYYVQRNDSIMGKAFDERRLQIMEAVEQTKAFVDEYDLPLSNQAENYEMLMYFNLLNDMILNHVRYEAVQKKICRFLLHHQEDYNKNPYVTRKHKIALLLLRVHLYFPFLRLYKRMG